MSTILEVITNGIRQYFTDGAAHVYNAFVAAGERNQGSNSGADFQVSAREWKSKTITVGATGDLLVIPYAAIVASIRVRRATNAGVGTANTAGIIIIKNGAQVIEAAAAGATAGTVLFNGEGGTLFPENLTINFASTSDTAKIEVLARPADTVAAWSL